MGNDRDREPTLIGSSAQREMQRLDVVGQEIFQRIGNRPRPG